MNKGKRKCERLKIIRKYIAKANGIEYEPTKCEFEGECPGTCPKCDAELAELQRQLDEKERRGEKVIYENEITLNDISEEDMKIFLDDFLDDLPILRGCVSIPIVGDVDWNGWNDEEEEKASPNEKEDKSEHQGHKIKYPTHTPGRSIEDGDDELAGRPSLLSRYGDGNGGHSHMGCIITIVVVILIIAALVWYFFIR